MKPFQRAISHWNRQQEELQPSGQGKAISTPNAAEPVLSGLPASSGPFLPQHAVYLQRTLGNQHTRRLLESSDSIFRQNEAPPSAESDPVYMDKPQISALSVAQSNTVQRLVTYNGNLAQLNEEDDDFKNLTSQEQTEVRNRHEDRTQIYDYPDQSAFYAHIGGDTTIVPTIKPVDQQSLTKAKKIKNRQGFYRANEKIGAPTDNTEFHKEENQGMLPVWYPMSHTGLDEKSLRWTRNSKSKKFELHKSKKLNAKQKKELDEMSLTVVEEKGSGKVHWNAHVGKNPASSFTDTDITSRPTGKRKSEYGGEDLSDYAEDTVGSSGKHVTDREDHYKKKKRKKDPQLTRGHQQAYEDTITKLSKKERVILGSKKKQVFSSGGTSKIRTTDQEQEPLPSGTIPSMMSPEQYDTGQHGRRTQIETPTRKEQGVYFEANSLTSDSGTTVGGMDIPGEKFYAKASKDRKTQKAGKFDQYSDVYDEKEDAGGWNELFEEYEIEMDEVPQQAFFESDEEFEYSDTEKEPQTPQFMDEFMETSQFFSPVELELGRELGQTYQGHDDWIVTEELSNTTAGIQYQISRTKFA
ncbi:hypothetical protein [Paenibacillus rigui]|uniref:Uncharacterized protein n=1 Tax=Paenibacillus rigui TaxID=554312 RepID=A0A229UKB2_9BACL|nr:hypothetical protein [Paenibacillus rigui]OXM83850.1 hypothetical protein CF651_23345 [Paenibacillus rigui]